jgi:TolB-like protein/Flp pilus assembly protein TadD
MLSGWRLRFNLQRLQSRLTLPYSLHWLRRVGRSFPLKGVRSSAQVESNHSHKRRRFRRSRVSFASPLLKSSIRDRLSRSFRLSIPGGSVRMAAEDLQRPALDEEDLLEGWKAIADHLNKTERTVQRWEKSKALPVRRLKAGSPEEQGRVFAYKTELDAWWKEMLTRADAIVELADSDASPVPPVSAPAANVPELTAPHSKRRYLLHLRFSLKILLWSTLAASFVFAFFLRGSINKLRTPQGRITLAVRPFKNLGPDTSDFVAEGLSQEMVTRLAQLHPQKMGVVPLSPGYATASIERLVNDISADYVLEGSVRIINDHVAITAELLQVSNQSAVWGQSYERDVKDLLRVQDEVADAIAGEVLRNLPHASQPAREVDREAYLAYLEGRYFWNKRTTESLTRALALFEKSVAIDPSYARSYSGLADCYELLGSAPYTALPPSEVFPKAEAAARKALELDNTLGEAHVSLGYSEMVYEWNLPEAGKEFVIALQLHPDYATGHQFYAYYLTAIGDLQGAVAERKRALELEPLNPLLSSALGEAFYQNRQFDLAIQHNSRSLELDPSYAVALVNIGRAYEMKGMHSQARDAFQKILSVAPDDPAVLALMGHEYASSGDKSKALDVIRHLKQLSAHTYVPNMYVALVYTGLHDLDNAFDWLNKAATERCEYLVYLPSEPLADPLRKDPRFPRLLHRLGLKPMKIPAASMN